MRLITIIQISLIIAAAFWLYQVKYDVRELKKEVAVLEKELNTEYDSIHVLQAEWAYLTRPDRLAKLASKYLKTMQTIDGNQLIANISLANVPFADSQDSITHSVSEENITNNNAPKLLHNVVEDGYDN